MRDLRPISVQHYGVAVLAGAFAMFWLAVLARPVSACVTGPPPDVWVIFHGLVNDDMVYTGEEVSCAWLTIHDYETFGAGAGDFCACALNQLGPIIEVVEVQVKDAATGEAIPGFDFDPNSVVGAEFDLAAGGGTAFEGFLSQISQEIPAGLPIALEFLVCMPADTTAEVLLQSLGDGSPLIGTDGANSDGTLVGDHQVVNAAASVMLACTVDADCLAGDFCFAGACIPAPSCGDAILDPGEDCDDGNTTDGDTCSATCEFEGKKIRLCHKGKKTITLSVRAVPAHLGHGDTFGVCP